MDRSDLLGAIRRHAKLKDNPILGTLLALIAGLVLGTLIHRSQQPTLVNIARGIDWIGLAWINALRMTIIPLVAATLIHRFAVHGGTQFARKLSLLSILVFVLLLGGGAIYTAILAPSVISGLPELHLPLPSAQSLPSASDKPAVFSWQEFINRLIPSNIFKAAVDGDILPIILVSILFGFALTRIDADRRRSLLIGLEAIHQTIHIIIRWIIGLMPIAVFALAISIAATIGWEAPGVLGYGVFVICLLLIGYTLILYLIAWLIGGVSLIRFAQAVAPAQLVACSTRSSLVSLPALILGAERRLTVPPTVSNLVLPLAVSIFKADRPVSAITKLYFLGYLYGVPISFSTMVVFAFSMSLISFSSPGLPSSAPLVSIPVFISAGIPIEGLILFNSVEVIPDIFQTVLNVTGDMTALTITGRLMSKGAHNPVPIQQQPNEI
jgi:proton glutamate symport protein